MTDRNAQMLAAFVDYERSRGVLRAEHLLVGTPLGTRLQRIIRLPDGWRLWLATNDYIYGTYMDLFSNGRIVRVTARRDEGDEIIVPRLSDDEIRSKL